VRVVITFFLTSCAWVKMESVNNVHGMTAIAHLRWRLDLNVNLVRLIPSPHDLGGQSLHASFNPFQPFFPYIHDCTSARLCLV
jgi:hypothetical protein